MHTMTHTQTRDELNPMAANSAVAAGLSAAGDGSGRGGGMQQHMLEKSWNQDAGGHDHFHCHQEQEHQQQLHDLLGSCGTTGSTPKQLKRKRLADSMEREESEAELVLELGQMVSSSRGFQEVTAGAGGSSNSSILGLDHPSCNVLLQLGRMRNDSSAAMSIGEGVRQILDPAVVVVDNLDNVVTDLGIGPPPNPNLVAPHGPTRECELRASTSLLGLRQCDIIMENLLEGQIQVPVVAEQSTSAHLVSSGAGYMPSLLMNSHKFPTIAPSGMTYMQVTSTQQQAEEEEEEEEEEEGEQGEEEEEDQDVEQQEYSQSMGVSTSWGTTSTSGTSGHSERPGPKVCRFRGCSKGPRGASGLCIAHGGGRRCQKNGCNKGAEGRTVFCKAHGGGRRCQTLGCTKSTEGKTDYCVGHGGLCRCTHEGCSKAARGRSGLCIRHGGGKRCQIESCTKSAEGYSGLCISHGGGRRCRFPACTKGAQGSTMFCKAHGGGKRCIIVGCNKGAEGSTPLCKGHGGGKRCLYDGGGICTKSVHGGTLYCVAHGGGKRCAVEGCAKSARGRTDFCIRHGGGKRCKVEGCGKSAQCSTDFCKAHGGGKRCQWGADQNGHVAFGNLSIYGDDPATSAALTMCDKFARGKTGLCVAHSGLVQDLRVQGGAAAAAAAAHAFTPSLAPGLFRGWLSNSGQTQPTTNTSFSSGVTMAVAGGSKPAGSGSDWEMQSVQKSLQHMLIGLQRHGEATATDLHQFHAECMGDFIFVAAREVVQGIEFLFSDAQCMSRMVGVGLERAKVLVTSGYKVEVMQLSESNWKRSWEKVFSQVKDSESSELVAIKMPKLQGDHVKRMSLPAEDISRKFGVSLKDFPETHVITLNCKEEQSGQFFPLVWKVVDEYRNLKCGSTSATTKQTSGTGSAESPNASSSQSIQQSTSGGAPNFSQSPSLTRQEEKMDDDEDDDKSLPPEDPLPPDPSSAPNDMRNRRLKVSIFPGAGGAFHDPHTKQRVQQRLFRKEATIMPVIEIEFLQEGIDKKFITVTTKTQCNLGTDGGPKWCGVNCFSWYQNNIKISFKGNDRQTQLLSSSASAQDDSLIETKLTINKALMASTSSSQEESRGAGGQIRIAGSGVQGQIDIKATETQGGNLTIANTQEIGGIKQIQGFIVHPRCRENDLVFNFCLPSRLMPGSSTPSGIDLQSLSQCDDTFEPKVTGKWIVWSENQHACYVFKVRRYLYRLLALSELHQDEIKCLMQDYKLLMFVNLAMTHLDRYDTNDIVRLTERNPELPYVIKVTPGG